MASGFATPVMQPAAAQPSGAQMFYDRLMSLTLRHDFYDGDLFPDFKISPTAPTQTLLHNLGLIARPRPAGIDIIYHTSRSAAILRYLHGHRRQRRAVKPSPDGSGTGNKTSTYGGCWSRLTFMLSLENNLFPNFTAMPLAMTPGERSLYLSNRYSTRTDGQRAQLIADWSKHSVPVPEVTFSPGHLHIGTPADAAEFILYDTSGRAILHADPGYAPVSNLPAQPTVPLRAHLSPGTDMHISMANEWPGLYSYEIKDKNSKTIANKEFFYAGIRLAPLLFVDLFLASPEEPADKPATERGCYPITLPETIADNLTDDAARNAIKPLDYEVRFAARETFWTYYIVLSSADTASKGLAIQAEPADHIEFDGPTEVTLPTGARAYSFTSRKPKALRRRSDISLRLQSGGAPGNGSSRILLERLPTPSAERISASRSQTLTDASAASEVFVYL